MGYNDDVLNLDKTFLGIMDEYGISMELEEDKRYKLFIEEFRSVWADLPDDEPVAFYGYMHGTVAMLRATRSLPQKRVTCVIERMLQDERPGVFLPFVKLEQAARFGVRHVFISGFESRNEMKALAIEHLPGARVYDIYENLAARGIEYDKYFFDITPKKIHLMLERRRDEYARAEGGAQRCAALKELIRSYLCIRDFVYARHYADILIKGGYADSQMYADMFNRLDTLFERVKAHIRSKNGSRAYIFLVDSLSLAGTEKMTFLQSFGAQGAVFTNAYSPAMYTRAMLVSCLTGGHYVSDGLYKWRLFRGNEIPLIQNLKGHGYSYKALSPYSDIWTYGIGDDYTGGFINYGTQSTLMWKGICETVAQEGNALTLVHIMETHNDYYSGYAEEPLVSCSSLLYSGGYRECDWLTGDLSQRKRQLAQRQLRQRDAALAYTDKQLEFYFDFLDAQRDTVLVTGDHMARLLVHDYRVRMESSHSIADDYEKVAIFLRSPGIEPCVVDKLYSLSGIFDVLNDIIEPGNTVRIDGVEWARCEIEPSYGKALDTVIDAGERGEDVPYQHVHSGFIRMRNDKELYTLYLDGYDEYMRLPEEENLIEYPQWHDRVAYIRGLIDIDPREVWRYMIEKFPRMRDYFWEHIRPEYRP